MESERKKYGTGAVRDKSKNKGRYDLVPYEPLVLVSKKNSWFCRCNSYNLEHWFIKHFSEFIRGNEHDDSGMNEIECCLAILLVLTERDSTGCKSEIKEYCIPQHALDRFAKRQEFAINEQGYPERNWELGMPFTNCIDSALRHFNQHRMDMEDEDHLAAAIFNVSALVFFMLKIESGDIDPSIDDRPSRD